MSEPARRYRANQIFAPERGLIHTSRHVLRAPTLAHDHDFFEIAWVKSGTGLHLSARGEQRAVAGDGWVLAPGAWHAFRDCQNLEVCNCCFGGALLERELVALREDAGANFLFFEGPRSLERCGLIAFHVDQTKLEALFGAFSALDAAESGLERIARLLLLLEQVGASFGVKHRAAPPAKPHAAVRAATELLQAEPQSGWTLTGLARRVHVAPGTLSRLFKAQTGMAPIAYLHRARAARAAQLLLQSELPIAQIGALVGWDDPNLFARRFRAHFGVCASVYRARFRAGAS